MSHYVFCVNIRQFLCRTPEEGSRKVALLAFWAGAIFEFEQFLWLVRFLARPFLFTPTPSPAALTPLPTLSRTCLRRLPSSRPSLLAPYLAKKNPHPE